MKYLVILALVCAQSAHAVSCKDFATQAEAQAYFNEHGAKSLDRDKDGVACESNKKSAKSKKAKRSAKKKVDNPF